MQLTNGQETLDPRLDRVYELDWRSLAYSISEKVVGMPVYRPRSYTWSVDAWLDQGPDGACVGFAFAHDLIARPHSVMGIQFAHAMEIYHEAQKIDPWDGGSYPGASPQYEGTSVLAGAKICQDRGFFKGYYWGLTVEECARSVAYWGPFIFGTNWHTYMFYPDNEGFLKPLGQVEGGHAVLVNAVKIKYKPGLVSWFRRSWQDVDWDRSYFTIHNSWGKSWADNGTAKITFRDFAYLLSQQGEACFPERNYERKPLVS